MPFPLLTLIIPALVKVVCATCIAGGTAYCVHKATDAYKKGQDTKQQAISAKSQADLTKIQTAMEDNKKIQVQLTDWKQKYEELEAKEKERDKKIEEATRKANDSNLSEDERRKWRNELVLLLSQREDGKKEKAQVLDTVKTLEERNKKNNQTISTTGSGSYENASRHWIWEFLTFENILIMGACYMLYQIALKDDRR